MKKGIRELFWYKDKDQWFAPLGWWVIGFIFVIIMVMLSGCATHYVPSACPSIESPPGLSDTMWVKIIFIDPSTGKEIVYYGLPEAEALKAKINVDKLKEYSIRCYELNKPE